MLTRSFEMVMGVDRVAGNTGDHGEQGVVDGFHARTMGVRAYSTLTAGSPVPVTVALVQIGLLGSLEVRDADGRDVAIPSGKQQALLALLAIHAGRVVPTERVVDALWGEDPPPRVRNGLQALASKLPNALGAPTLG